MSILTGTGSGSTGLVIKNVAHISDSSRRKAYNRNVEEISTDDVVVKKRLRDIRLIRHDIYRDIEIELYNMEKVLLSRNESQLEITQILSREREKSRSKAIHILRGIEKSRSSSPQRPPQQRTNSRESHRYSRNRKFHGKQFGERTDKNLFFGRRKPRSFAPTNEISSTPVKTQSTTIHHNSVNAQSKSVEEEE